MVDLRHWVLAAAVLWLGACSLPAAEPGAKPPEAVRVARLIAHLGSNQASERDAASRELATLGPAALDGLRRAAESEDPEVRRRARQMLQKAEQCLLNERLLKPRSVRLVYQDVPVTAAVADLARKTGLRLQIIGDAAPLAQRRLTLDTGETTLWDALAQFCRKAGLADRGLDPAVFQEDRSAYKVGQRDLIVLDRTSSDSDGRAASPLRLADGPWQELPTYHAGAIRIRALPPTKPTASTSRPTGEKLLVLEVIPEPQLQWQSVLAVRVDRAVGAKGPALKQPLVVSGLGGAVGKAPEEVVVLWDGSSEFPANPFGDARHVAIRLGPADGPWQHLQELRGTITARVGMRPEKLAAVDNILQATGKTVRTANDQTLQVVEVKRTEEGQYQLRVALTTPPPELISGGIPARLIVHKRGWWGQGTGDVSAESCGFALLDAQGRSFPLASGEVQGLLAQGIRHDFTLLYRALPDRAPPARLQYTGRRSVTIEVPFTLRNVPLSLEAAAKP
jgi:hypothetical protein